MSDYIVFRCKYYNNGVCLLYSDSEVTEYCVEGPCPDEVNDGTDSENTR